MQYRSIIIRASITLLVLLGFLLHVAGVADIRLVSQLENIAYDARVRFTMPGVEGTQVVIVDIDERSIGVEGHWPWPRDRLAALTEQLFDQYEVHTVSFDINFPEADRNVGADVLRRLAAGPLSANEEFLQVMAEVESSLQTDERFAEALRDRNVVLGFVFREFEAQEGNNEIGALPAPMHAKTDIEAGVSFLEAAGYTGNVSVLQQAARSGGFFDNPVVDRDGVFRRVPALQQYNDGIYPSLAIETARAALGWPQLDFVFASDADVRNNISLEWLRLGERRIPVDQDLALYVPYRGPSFTIPYVSATDVLSGAADIALLRDKIVMIGTSAPGLLDTRVTPVSEAFVGVEVHANIVDGILSERVKYRPAYMRGAHITLLVLLAVVLTWLLTRYSVVPATLATVTLVVVLVVSNLLLWTEADFIVPLASPLLFVAVVFLLQILYGLLIESRGKRHLTQMFGQYVPPELVEEMNLNQQDISLEGESREMTVLFSDVRGFTNLSEGLDPKQLTQLMNEFLTPLTRAIHEQRGTIDKYMGDAVMAFWGAPLEDDEHASHAVAAALDIVAVMDRLGPEFRAKGWPELRVGIGLNTGVMSVGNMGSEFRMAYTVMGDAVNLGSRLEGLTKAYGVNIIVSEYTRDAAPEFAYLELDRVRVKGKAEPVAIFEPLGRRDALPKEAKQLRARHKQALMFYRGQQWDAAEREFFTLSQAEPSRALYRIYLERIAHFRRQPPGADWDGVFTFSTK